MRQIFCFLKLIVILGITGCATVRTITPGEPFLTPRDAYHQVRPGETLWQIARVYGVSVDEIVKANNIPNAAYIEANQLLVIPDRRAGSERVVREEVFDDDSFQWPVKGSVLSYFGERKSTWVNTGISIRSRYGQEIFPAQRGEVVFSDLLPGYGQTVIIDHGNGYHTVYGHNAEALVSIGDFVRKDTAIAKVGGRGTIAFLHFEIRRHAEAKNPLYFLP